AGVAESRVLGWVVLGSACVDVDSAHQTPSFDFDRLIDQPFRQGSAWPVQPRNHQDRRFARTDDVRYLEIVEVCLPAAQLVAAPPQERELAVDTSLALCVGKPVLPILKRGESSSRLVALLAAFLQYLEKFLRGTVLDFGFKGGNVLFQILLLDLQKVNLRPQS